MNILLDTHVLIWWLLDDPRLCSISRSYIGDLKNNIYVSSASAWEIATKYRLGKMPEGETLINNYQFILEKEGFIHLPITMKQALRAGSLQIEHRDPFDRMLMAQAELENLAIITYDSKFHLKHLTIIPSHPSF